jgi:alanine racemase
MDQTVVRLDDTGKVGIGDEVVVFGGDDRSGAPSVAELAAILDTIPYEVVVGIMPRVPRHYEW